MDFATNLYYAIVSVAETVTFGTSETLLSILTGAFVGYLSIKLVLFIDQRRARKLLESSTQKRTSFNVDVDVKFVTDAVDSAAWDSFDFGLLYIAISMAGSLLSAATLNATGLVAFAVSNLAFALTLPILAMRNRTLRLIDETICETEHTVAVDRRLSKEFYKKLVDRYKSGRKWAEFFTYTNYILEQNLEYIRATT